MIVAVASGRGGTGKTTIVTNMAVALERIQFIDCDVEEPNAHLFLKPHIEETIPVTIPIPVIDQKKCTHCGGCAEACAFDALVVFPKDGTGFRGHFHGVRGLLLCVPRGVHTGSGKRNRNH